MLVILPLGTLLFKYFTNPSSSNDGSVPQMRTLSHVVKLNVTASFGNRSTTDFMSSGKCSNLVIDILLRLAIILLKFSK